MTHRAIGNAHGLFLLVLLVACGGGGGGSSAAPDSGGGSGGGAQIPTSQLPPGSPPFNVDRYVCRDVQLGAVTLDNVQVPAGATCALIGSRVEGTVTIERGAFLEATGVSVDGNIQSEGAANVLVDGQSIVDGSIQLEQGQSATLLDVQVNSDIQLISNAGFLRVERNRVGGNIQVRQNTGGVTLVSNTAVGNLECQANQPPPTGSGNVAATKEDQCSAL